MLSILLIAAQATAAPAAPPTPGPRIVRHRPAPPKIAGPDSCVEIKFSDSMPVLPATIAGKKVSLGFDTGAPGAPLLKKAIIDELKLTQVGEARMSDPSLRNVVTVPIFGLQDLKIGNLTVAEWTASREPERETKRLSGPDGIIGLTAFQGYVVTIDYPSGRVLFTKGRLPEADGRTSFKYDDLIPQVPLNIDGKAINAAIDTGNARYSLILPEAYAASLAGHSDRFPIGIARTINNTFNLMAQPIREAKVGDIPLYAGTAAYPGPSSGRGNIGSPLLKDMIVKVDPANSIVALERAKPGLENGCPSA